MSAWTGRETYMAIKAIGEHRAFDVDRAIEYGQRNLMMLITLEEIKHDLPSYLRRVEEGETLVLTQEGKPFAEIRPIAVVANGLRPFGMAAGEFIVPDDFDEPLPEEVIQDFEGI